MPLPMPLISRGCPAYTNDDFSGAFPANHANNATYGATDYWRCAAAPASSANSGVLCQSPGFTVPFPVYLAYDLSGVANLGLSVLHWDQSATTGNYNAQLISQNVSNVPVSYTIDANVAAGGSLPSSGWVTLVTVTNSAPYHSRQHLIDLTGYKWVRLRATSVVGSGGGVNANVALNMDIHRAPLGATDSWFFAGDSITQFAFEYNDQAGLSTIMPQQVANTFPAFFPIWENGGIAGWTATDAQPVLPTWLALFPGQYVALNFGTNDANGGGALVTNFSVTMQSMITAILNAGKIPVIPRIPWGGTAGLLANVPTLNGYIDTLIAANPGCIAGPDLYTYFNANQSLIDSDGIHPTNPTGYNAYRTQWVNWAVANIYRNVLVTTAQSRFKVRAVQTTTAQSRFKVRTKLNTSAQSKFLIQLVNIGPKPYFVTGTQTIIYPRPYSTIASKATVIDESGVLQSTLNCTVTVTFPDNSTATPTVYSLGSGVYSTSYNTKGEGTVNELWVFTDGASGQVEYQNEIVCSY